MIFQIKNIQTSTWVDILGPYQENNTLDARIETVTGPNARVTLDGTTRPDDLAQKAVFPIVTRALTEADAQALQTLLMQVPVYVRTDYLAGASTQYKCRRESFTKAIFRSSSESGSSRIKISAQLREL